MKNVNAGVNQNLNEILKEFLWKLSNLNSVYLWKTEMCNSKLIQGRGKENKGLLSPDV